MIWLQRLTEKTPLGAEWDKMTPDTKMASQEGPVSRQRQRRLPFPGRRGLSAEPHPETHRP